MFKKFPLCCRLYYFCEAFKYLMMNEKQAAKSVRKAIPACNRESSQTQLVTRKQILDMKDNFVRDMRVYTIN